MPRMTSALILLMLATASSAAQADAWYASWNHTSFGGGFNPGFYGRNDFWRGGHAGAAFGHWSRPERGWNHRFDRFDRWRSYDRGYSRGYRRGFRHGSRWGHGNWGYGNWSYGDRQAASLLGGVVLGSLLTQTFSTQPVIQQPVVVSQRVVHSRAPTTVVRRRDIPIATASGAPARSTDARPNSYLLRDLHGDCFAVERQADGTEIRSQVDSSQCEF